MNAETLDKIKLEVEKIEKDPKHGKVLISIFNGYVNVIQPTPTIKRDRKNPSWKLT